MRREASPQQLKNIELAREELRAEAASLKRWRAPAGAALNIAPSWEEIRRCKLAYQHLVSLKKEAGMLAVTDAETKAARLIAKYTDLRARREAEERDRRQRAQNFEEARIRAAEKAHEDFIEWGIDISGYDKDAIAQHKRERHRRRIVAEFEKSKADMEKAEEAFRAYRRLRAVAQLAPAQANTTSKLRALQHVLQQWDKLADDKRKAAEENRRLSHLLRAIDDRRTRLRV